MTTWAAGKPEKIWDQRVENHTGSLASRTELELPEQGMEMAGLLGSASMLSAQGGQTGSSLVGQTLDAIW